MKKPQLLPCWQSGFLPKLNVFQMLHEIVVTFLVTVIEATFIEQSRIALVVVCTIPFARRIADKPP
ncbi:hypothetical protein WJ20_09795 [Burkholderia vietnamiensis]|nr:hypothetical protein WJ04_13500 [Burkholderia vietnamiensis]KVF92050.1 hypothetical protein WJ20_09795 [Burkholderia vietnamiensis]KVR92221.1 hypothetical protein WK28_02860 [Burkholderia vietnamiensis]